MLMCCAAGAAVACVLGGGLGAVEGGVSPEEPGLHRLTHVTNAYATWSPDGTRVVYQANDGGSYDLYTMTPGGMDRRRIVSSGAHDITPVFAPDGKRIVFVSERDGNREVYLCDADGGNQVNVTNDPGHDLHPVFNGDGSEILFSSNRENADAEDYDLYAIRVDGTGLRRITDGPDVDTYASWSPDGTRIVTRRVVSGNNEVFVLNADGTGGVNLTDSPAYEGWPVWSPDGAWIAFAGGQPGGGQVSLYLVRPDGTGRVRLTDRDDGEDRHPSFSPNGRWLMFTRYREGAMESSDICVLVVEERVGV